MCTHTHTHTPMFACTLTHIRPYIHKHTHTHTHTQTHIHTAIKTFDTSVNQPRKQTHEQKSSQARKRRDTCKATKVTRGSLHTHKCMLACAQSRDGNEFTHQSPWAHKNAFTYTSTQRHKHTCPYTCTSTYMSAHAYVYSDTHFSKVLELRSLEFDIRTHWPLPKIASRRLRACYITIGNPSGVCFCLEFTPPTTRPGESNLKLDPQDPPIHLPPFPKCDVRLIHPSKGLDTHWQKQFRLLRAPLS